MNPLDSVVVVLFLNTVADLVLTIMILTFVIHSFAVDVRTKRQIEKSMSQCEDLFQIIRKLYNSLY